MADTYVLWIHHDEDEQRVRDRETGRYCSSDVLIGATVVEVERNEDGVLMLECELDDEGENLLLLARGHSTR